MADRGNVLTLPGDQKHIGTNLTQRNPENIKLSSMFI